LSAFAACLLKRICFCNWWRRFIRGTIHERRQIITPMWSRETEGYCSPTLRAWLNSAGVVFRLAAGPLGTRQPMWFQCETDCILLSFWLAYCDGNRNSTCPIKPLFAVTDVF
jgi:hypothetical protein